MYAMRIGVVLALLTCALSGCAPMRETLVTLDGIEVQVEVADNPAERSRGLQGHDQLVAGEGMLFIFEDAAPRTFAMKDVSFPIDVVFIAEDGTVSAIEPLDPGDTRLVSSPGPCRYVVELPQGWAAREGIVVGSAFEVAE